MNPLSDYHIHTDLCGHAVGHPSDYASRALEMGFEEIGFSDHAPLVTHEDPSLSMNIKQLPLYHQLIEKVRADFSGRLNIKIGIEADFVDGYQEKIKSLLDGYPYDYVIGSVHCMDSWMFDHPDERHLWDEKDIDEVYRTYFAELRKSAGSGLFDIIGHLDLVKKFGHRPKANLETEIEKTAEVLQQHELVVEINTSGLRKPVKEIYPSLDILKILCRHGVPITFGSDSHKPEEIGMNFDLAVQLARKAGYTEYVLFRKRKVDRTISLH